MINQNGYISEKLNAVAKKIEQIKAENEQHLKALEHNNRFMECLANNVLAIADVCESYNIQFVVVSSSENGEINIARKA